MDLEQQIKAAQDLIAKREEIERKLAELFGGKAPERKQRVCSRCNQPGHLAKSCSVELQQPGASAASL